MRTLAVVLVVILVPGPALGAATQQAEAERPQAEVQTKLDLTASEQTSPSLTFEETLRLLRQPGYHPELVELLGLESVSTSHMPHQPGGESHAPYSTQTHDTGPAGPVPSLHRRHRYPDVT